MKLRAILLLLMLGFDASLHWVDILNKVSLHPLYPNFPLWGFIPYNIFWAIYWSVGFLIMLTLLGSGTTVKNTTITHTHIHNELPKITKESDVENKQIKNKIT